jgi:hypothetical protein
MKAAKDYLGDGFRIESRWKEEVIYWEGDHGFRFDAGWGVDPSVLYVPSAGIWQEVMPAWLRDRRDDVLARLRQHSGHILQEDIHGHYRRAPESRILTEKEDE